MRTGAPHLASLERRHWLGRGDHSTESESSCFSAPPAAHHKSVRPRRLASVPLFHFSSLARRSLVSRPHSPQPRMESNQSAARAARRFLDERVRDDWEWPQKPDCWSASDEEVRRATVFRERYYGDSSPESSDDEAATDPYKFDSPDSIGHALERKVQRRKRRRRAALEHEMKENEGLRIWVERRDAWTGAAAVRKYAMQRAAATTSTVEATVGSIDPTSSDASTPMDTDSQSSSRDDEPASVEPLVPLARPFLADNAIRKSITPKTYPDIFNKIVLSARTPSVPINLSDMTKALVQGWQENGEWPPKAAALDPLAGKKRAALAGVKADNGTEPFLSHHPHLQKGMDSVKRIFHLNGHHHETHHETHHEGGHGEANNG